MTTKSDVRILDHRTPEERDRSFLPGMGKPWLMPLYDTFTRVAGIGDLHQRAVELAGIHAGQQVIDVGCGTGNLSLAVLAAHPDARVTGLDPDGDSLRRDARKARRRRVSLTLVQGYADRIPAEDTSLDHVVSSLALHHVNDEGRGAFAREALRVLKPGGIVTIVDFDGPSPGDQAAGHSAHSHSAHSHGAGPAQRHFSFARRNRAARQAIAGNLGNGIVTLLADAGLADVHEIDHVDHRFGQITFVQAIRP